MDSIHSNESINQLICRNLSHRRIGKSQAAYYFETALQEEVMSRSKNHINVAVIGSQRSGVFIGFDLVFMIFTACWRNWSI